ncbi:hypothetical protein ACET52_05380 [Aeromonas veronii]
MKAIYISFLAMAFGANATVVEYQLEQDGIVDGIVTEGNTVDLTVNKQQEAFSGYDESSVTRGYFSNNEKVIRFDKTTKDTVSYYLGTKSEDGHYKGNWYDTNGNGGDFRLLSSDIENEGCSGATQTGWHNGQYCNMGIDGGGWQLVATRTGESVDEAVEQITTLTKGQHLNKTSWNELKEKMKEILFLQPNTGVWGIMNITSASSPKLCKPLSDDLGSPVLLHAEDGICDASGTDYTYVGNRQKAYQGSLYFHPNSYKLWIKENRSHEYEYFYSDEIMIFVR